MSLPDPDPPFLASPQSKMASYHLAKYWEQRYQMDTEPFEWYQRFSDLKPKIADAIPKNGKVLVVGAGSSELSADLYDDADFGVSGITNIDISTVITKRMQACVGDRKGMEYQTQDVCELALPNNSFDCVIDKATLDSIMCGEDAVERAGKALQNIFRVLKPQGYFICVSYAGPDMRMSYLTTEDLDWDVEVREIPKPKLLDSQTTVDDFHYIYVCKKRGEPVVTDSKSKKK